MAALDRRVEPRVHEQDEFVITLWTYYESATSQRPPTIPDALARMHAGLRELDIPAPHFGDRRAIGQRGGTEQLPDGEPHPGNVLTTKKGLLFS